MVGSVRSARGARAGRGGLVLIVGVVLALVGALVPIGVLPAGAVGPTPVIDVVARGIQPTEIAAGPDGNVWFTNQYADSVSRMTPAGVVTSFTGPGLTGPVGITAGPDGNLWVTNPYTDSLSRITTAGVVTPITSGMISYPMGITGGPDGNVWFTNLDAIGRVTPAGVVTIFNDAKIEYPTDIAAGPDGNLWFVNSGDGSIGRITPAGVVTRFADANINAPARIVAGPDGALWFTNASYPTASIGRISTAGVTTKYTSDLVKAPNDIVAGPDGALWFTNRVYGNGTPDTLGRITTAGVISSFATGANGDPRSITSLGGYLWYTQLYVTTVGKMTPGGGSAVAAGPSFNTVGSMALGSDGNMWFPTGFGSASAIIRVTPAGAVTAFTDPVINYPSGITAGPDGNLWFTNNSGNSVGRITTAGVVTTFTGTGVQNPNSITAGPDGNLWFTNVGSDSIGRVTPAGVVSNFTATGILDPTSITPGPDGNLWFRNYGYGALPGGGFGVIASIGRVTPAGVVTIFADPKINASGSITAGPDGNLWFTNYAFSGGSVGRITPAGVVTDFTSAGLAGPNQITTGPDGNLWFTSASNGQIGRLTTAGAITLFPTAFDILGGISAGPGSTLWFGANYVLARISFADVPSAPTAVIAVGGKTTATVSWAAPGSPGSSAITGYTVTSSPGGKTCTWTSGPLTCTVTGLTNGTAYTFTVKATNASGPGATSTPSAPAVPLGFLDVPPGAPFFGDIGWLVSSGVANGYADNTFRPTAPVSRQAMAAFLYRFAGSPRGASPTCATDAFKDVPKTMTFCGEIKWLVDAGITTGYSDGTFQPAAAVSRQAMAAFIYRFAGKPYAPACSSPPFTDVPAASTFCKEISWLVSTGITTGFADGSFKPASAVSRQAMAAFLHRLWTYQHPAL